jgi:calpain family cysteine protease
VAARAPGYLQGMFTYDGTAPLNGATVGVWTVRFFHNGVADYVTVNTALPDGGSYYDSITSLNPDGTTSTQLWAALAEKAYAQENESGWIGTSSPGVNSYQALNIGWPSWALQALTGLPTTDIAVTGANVADAWTGGKLIALGTVSSPASSTLVPDHAYAVVDYDPSSSSPFVLYNPWGLNGLTMSGQFRPGLVAATTSSLAQDFRLDTTCGAIPPTGAALPGGPAGAPGRHSEGARQPALIPARVDRAGLVDAALAAIEQPRDDRLLALSGTIAGHNKHVREGRDWLFAEYDRDS